jgi:16S rRNA (uracil1498-N3)-methyltransferase
MNTLLLESSTIVGNEAVISGRQHQHVTEIQRVVVGDTLRVGEINGQLGSALITAIDEHCTCLNLTLTETPPLPIPLTLVLALPRPKMLRRILQTVAAMGVKKIHLINASRVEKSYWQSPMLEPDAIRQQLILGLEQACDSRLPEFQLHPLFKPFVEDQLPALAGGQLALVAHPYTEDRCPVEIAQAAMLAVGPEGGFIPYEINKLHSCGFKSVHIGSRILRVETAIPALLSRLFPL